MQAATVPGIPASCRVLLLRDQFLLKMHSEMRGPVGFHRFSKLFLGLVLIVSLLLAGCNRRASTSSNVAMAWLVTPQPARVGRTEITVSLNDDLSEPLSGAKIQLEADMAHAGMAPVFADAKETAPGKYEGRLDLTMPGDWVVLVHGGLSNGEKLERQIALNGVKAK